jgi:hypothetical protein
MNDAEALAAAGIHWPKSIDSWRWLYRHREARGMAGAFRKVGGRVLVDVRAFKELAGKKARRIRRPRA